MTNGRIRNSRPDAIVIGGGHNALVAAAYLARAGRKVTVLERRPVVGGAAVTEEVFPGFKFSVFSYVVSLLRPEIIRELELPRHGLHILPLESTLTPLDDGDYLAAWADPDETRAELCRHSPRDAEAMVRFGRLMQHMAMAVKPILSMLPPDPASLAPRDLLGLLRLSGHFRSLGAERFHALCKLMTMSSADYLDEWFEFDALKATKSASGIIGTFLGPRSPGSAYVLLHHYMGEIDGAFRAWGFQKGGTGGISEAIAGAARAFGATIRTDAQVERVLVQGGRTTGVALSTGEEIRAPLVVSGLDPHRSLLQLVDPAQLPDDLAVSLRRYKFRGSSGKVNLALDGLPDFTCKPGPGAHLRGAISISPSLEYLERAYDDAKQGSFSRQPYMDVVIPSMIDPGMAPPGKHVMSIFVQYAPYHLQGGWTDPAREAFGDAVVDTLSRYAPNLKSILLHRQVLTPLDIERMTGLTEGNIFQGELALQQLFFLRPAPRWAKYRTPIAGYWQCGSGTHPGGGIMGASGRLAAMQILGAVVNGSFDAIVIGGGPNGLVAAAALGRAAKKVLLLERAAELGGQGRLVEFAPGFRAAPLGTDPGWLPETVARGLGLPLLEREHTEAPVTVAAGAGDWLTLWRDPARAAEAIARRAPADAAKWPAFVARLQRLATFLASLYEAPPPDVTATGLREWLALAGLGWRLRRLGRQDMTGLLRLGPMPVQDLLDDEFQGEALKAAVGAAGIQGIRQGPRSGGTAFVLLHHLVGAPAGAIRGRGSFREPDTFARAVAAVALRHGVVLRTAAPVAHIEVQRDAVAGVVLADGERIAAPAVLSTADPATTFSLVDPVWLDPEVLHALRNIKYRGSTAHVLYALDALPALPGLSAPDAQQALAGTVTLTGSLAAIDRAADAAKYGRVSEPLHVECCVPTLRWPALAPAGRHVLVATLRYVPYRLREGAGWDAARSEALAAAATAAIEAAFPGFAARVLQRAVLTPRDLAQQFALPEGAASHGELTLDQVLFLRPLPGCARYATPIRGLWWGGCGTHPGPGVLGGSGWLAAQRLLRSAP